MAALAFSAVRTLPVIHGFWLGYVRTVIVGTTSSMHLLKKPVTDVVNFSMTSDESRNMFLSVLAKQSSSLASTYHLSIEHITGAWNQEDRVLVRFAKWRDEGELCIFLCLE